MVEQRGCGVCTTHEERLCGLCIPSAGVYRMDTAILCAISMIFGANECTASLINPMKYCSANSSTVRFHTQTQQTTQHTTPQVQSPFAMRAERSRDHRDVPVKSKRNFSSTRMSTLPRSDRFEMS